MDSKGHHCEPSHPLGVSHPFANHHIQTNHRAPSWTRSPKRTCAPINHRIPWDQHAPTLVRSSCRRTPTSLVYPFSWFLPPHASPHAWERPLACLHAQGAHFPN
jgi:hypothetical protein